ncbi:MAG: methylaspartate mutase accessory protein GlmL [Dehalococcoidales bacterium]
MDDIRLLIDFGSTFTKVAAVDLDTVEVIATARVPSTVETDITVGLEIALKEIAAKTGIGNLDKKKSLACSSAAGGLRMICVGFVPELTSQAANHAALGAGAKVVGLYSFKLTSREIDEIESLSPDILLLSGGTDGGDEAVIIHNASMLAKTDRKIDNIIVAGNKTTYDTIKDTFNNSGKHIIYTKNVMPEIGVLDTAPCNKEIREIFIKNIIQAKGIARAKTIVGDVIMPTPSAVLEAAKLLAEGCEGESGYGELIVIDPGGATTDVHSIAEGIPTVSGIAMINTLPEPYVKRTVEGNLGLKYNIDSLSEFTWGKKLPPRFKEICRSFHEGQLPKSPEEITCHQLLSHLAVDIAVTQHVGRLEKIYGPTGEMMLQHGKDLTGVKTVIGTGGPVIFSASPREIMEGALYQKENPLVLKPRNPILYLDEQYILYAIGLLSQIEPKKALLLAKKYLKQI